MAILGTATADTHGNWSLETTVPSTVIRESDKAEGPTLYGTWTVAGVTVGPDGGLYGSRCLLTVIEYIPASTTTSNTTQYTAAALPNTGVLPAGLWLTGAGLLAGAFGGSTENGPALTTAWRVQRQHQRRRRGIRAGEPPA